jgi:hypothetical protein
MGNEKGGNMIMNDLQYNYGYAEKIKDFDYENKPEKTFSFSPFDIEEIQYLKRLIVSEQFNHNYQNAGKKESIDQNTTMYEFTERLLKNWMN